MGYGKKKKLICRAQGNSRVFVRCLEVTWEKKIQIRHGQRKGILSLSLPKCCPQNDRSEHFLNSLLRQRRAIYMWKREIQENIFGEESREISHLKGNFEDQGQSH